MAYTVLKGYEGTIEIGDGATTATTVFNVIGRVESFTVEVNQNLERFSQIGTRKTVIVDGNIEISGSFSRAFIDAAILSMATGIVTSGGNVGSSSSLPQDINVRASGLNTSNGREYNFVLLGVTIDSVSIELSPTDIVMEDVDYIARSLEFRDSPNAGLGGANDFLYDDGDASSGLFG